MCKCLEQVEKKTEDAIRASLSKRYNKISRFGEAGITTVGIMFSGPMSRRLYFPFEAEYYFTKVNGEESRRRVEKASIMFSFCPFCGEKYPEEKSETHASSKERV